MDSKRTGGRRYVGVRAVREALLRHTFRYADEPELHRGIVEVLAAELGLACRREVRLDAQNRIDLTTELARPGLGPVTLGIEVKVGGNAGGVRRQLLRYAGLRQLDALLLVTTMYRHISEVMLHVDSASAGEAEGAGWLLGGKPFEPVLLNRGIM